MNKRPSNDRGTGLADLQIRSVNCVAAATLSLLFACGGSDEARQDSPPAPPPPAAAGAILTSGAITHIAITANSIDVAAAELAKTQGTNPDVLRFAQTMAADHNALIKLTEQLATTSRIEPAANPTSEQLQAVAKAARVRLEALTGAEFDRAYIENEIVFHQGLLDTLDRILIPAVQSAELKKLLEETRPAVAAQNPRRALRDRVNERCHPLPARPAHDP
jgi:putative membrane protein